ncbi:cellulose binding domain-containing protein [Saccharothrix yanglingensis]|uniref:cellulose binding domain-containing protein n=1 Tax=Saccharothrix yanglingensis TaxID=659496 RepID=UPI0027D2F85F|nr:cellulose binding domain-containing protein [Saccharothrix yanglingensis]
MSVFVSGMIVGAPTGSAAAAGPDLRVDIAADRLPISEDIYGMNFASEEMAADLRLPVQRWGGNHTTRYNFRYDNTDRASDWYFENIDEPGPAPSTLPDGSTTDRAHEQNVRTGTKTLLSVPLLGWGAKGRDEACGFSVDVTTTGLTLSWPAVAGAADYTVERDGTATGRTAGTTLSVTGLTADTACTSTVRANNAAGDPSPPSRALSVRTKRDDSQPGTGCDAVVRVVDKWPGAFRLDLTVRNTGTEPGTAWTATLTLAAGMSVGQTWNGQATTTGTKVTVKNAPWNDPLIPTATATAGMSVNGDPAGWNPTPTCSLS